MGHRIIRIADVLDKTGFSRTTVYRMMDKFDFPRPIALGGQAVGWVESEIDRWIEEQMDKRPQRTTEASMASR